jgi:hypothetical protein
VSRRQRQLLAAIAACSAAGLGACGSSDEPKGKPLPSASVSQLQQRLDEIERRYQDAVDNGNVGACNDIGDDSLPAVEDVIASLPDNVDTDLRDALEQSFDRLRELTEQECADVEPEPEPEPEPVPEEPVPEETVPEETVPEETVPEETAPEETVPQDDGQSDGTGNGNSNGNGNGNSDGTLDQGGLEVPPDKD